MKRINMPPGMIQVLSEDCIVYGDTLTITFSDSGAFGSVPRGAFTPDLPIGLFSAGSTIGPFTAPTHDSDVYLAFVDTDHSGAFTVHLKVRATC